MMDDKTEPPNTFQSPYPVPGAKPVVYLVLPDATETGSLRDLLDQNGYCVEWFSSLESFREVCSREDIPAALIMDMCFPEGDEVAPRLLAELKARCQHCPPVIFTSKTDDIETRLSAYRAGASRYMVRPLDGIALLRMLKELIWQAPEQPYRVLMVDDNPLLLEAHAMHLRAAGMQVRGMTDPLQVLAVLREFVPDVLLLDLYMPRCSGIELAALLREQEEYRSLPILFLSAENDVAKQLLALNLGGDDYLVKPVDPRYLVAATAARARRARQQGELLSSLSSALYEREREHLAINQHAIVSYADADGNITYVNDRFCTISGYTRDEMLGQNHRLVKSGMHSPEFYRQMWSAISSGRVWQGELCNRSKDGRLYWVESTITPFLDGAGKPYQYISIRTDITHVKQAESALRVSEERLRRSQAYANIGTWDWDIRSDGLYWSERIAPLFGYPEGTLETSYENFMAAVHPDDRQMLSDAVENCIEHGLDYVVEHRCVWPDGTVRWLLERGDVVRDEDGMPLHMLGVVQDVTERKQAEQGRAEHRARLLEAQRLARLGNWVADMTSGELDWSEEIYRIFGYEPGSFTPSIEAFIQAVHPEDIGLVRASERNAEKTGRHDVVHRIVRPDGEVRYVHELAETECDEAGTLVRMVGTVQDVTELKRAEQAMLLAKEEAERASQAKSEFLSRMSHELRTPMNAILGFGQLLECDAGLNAEQQDNVHEILHGGRHLLELINEVLDLARVESGRIDLSLEPVLLSGVVDECFGMVQPLADARSIRLSRVGEDGVHVRADRTRIKQVLLNLMSNAIKYNRECGDVRIEVRVTGNERARICVEDTGQGIPNSRIEELFQPFNRLGAEASDIEGTGIGLTITRRLVEMMGGHVGVESELGTGSRFWVEFPIEEVTHSDHHACPAGGGCDAAKAGGHTHRVLYIEDNPANLKLISQLLARRQHLQLITAHTANLGLELAAAHRPELILLDINMPGMDGYQLLSVLRADERLKTIPVVAITANAMPRDIERGLQAGFVDYLSKPIDIHLFNATLDRWLEGEWQDGTRRVRS
jgi:PAS domain S-box-containing protein